MSTDRVGLSRRQWTQVAALTAGSALLFWGVRRLPTGTALGHMDFRVAGGNSIEFCDPANPQFLPVVDVPSPVSLALVPGTAERDREQAFVLTLRTVSGKPIGPDDLALAHTRKLHLLVIDPSLEDYQHVHPEPADKPGEWRFALTPRRGGTYRVFADFVPVATGRGLYAVAEFAVPGASTEPTRVETTTAERAGLRFTLAAAQGTIRAREMTELGLSLENVGGGPVVLEPVMGAFAHLVAFDTARRGFAHLHPNETDLARPPDAQHPHLSFKVTLPAPGRYVVWAQVRVQGAEVFAPFTIDVR